MNLFPWYVCCIRWFWSLEKKVIFCAWSVNVLQNILWLLKQGLSNDRTQKVENLATAVEKKCGWRRTEGFSQEPRWDALHLKYKLQGTYLVLVGTKTCTMFQHFRKVAFGSHVSQVIGVLQLSIYGVIVWRTPTKCNTCSHTNSGIVR